MRALTLLVLSLALAACAARRDGHDGMDGAGVAALVRHTFNQPDR